MKKIFLNLSIQSKLILGFILICSILLFTGINEYNVLQNLQTEKEAIVNTVNYSNSIKQIKYLVVTDLYSLKNAIDTKAEKDLKKFQVLNKKNNSEIISLFDYIKRYNTENTLLKDRSTFETIIKDSVALISGIYTSKIETSYAEIVNVKTQLLNPQNIFENDLSLNISDTTQNFSDYQYTQAELIKIKEKQIEELFLFAEKNIKDIQHRFSSLEKLAEKEVKTRIEKSNNLTTASIRNVALLILFSFIAAILIAVIISRSIVRPIRKLLDLTYKLAIGELPSRAEASYNDEVGEMTHALNSLIDGLKRTSDFAYDIGKGNFDSGFKPLSEKDVLGNSLINMRKSLQQANEEENKRKIEDIQRNWATEGLAKFAEILRHHTENISELSNDIIKNLVKYLKANQGGIFIYNDSDKNDIHLELLAVYAYNRKRYMQKKIKLGEGLIGAVAVEKYTIYMTDVPNEYIEIESGIGSANPKCILVVPLKIENDILGIIELASFNYLQKHEIELVERIADSIASTLSTARINTRTAELLKQSELQTQEMLEQESQMLQTIEQLRTTQEESIAREERFKKNIREMEALQKALEDKDYLLQQDLDKLKFEIESSTKQIRERESQNKIIFDTSIDAFIIINNKGTIEYFNKAAQKLWGYNENELNGRNIRILFSTFENIIDALTLNEANSKIAVNKDLMILKKNAEEQMAHVCTSETSVLGEIKYVVFVKDMKQISQLEAEKQILYSSSIAKEFEASMRIQQLEDFIKSNNLMLPGTDEETTFIKWEDGYSINLMIIDQQHRKWIELINKFYKTFKAGASKKELGEIFTELYDYIEYHFGFEEKYLNDFKCEGYENHLKEHESFIKKIQQYQLDIKKNKQDTAYVFLSFMKNWVRHHILEVDVAYVETFKRNGLI